MALGRQRAPSAATLTVALASTLASALATLTAPSPPGPHPNQLKIMLEGLQNYLDIFPKQLKK